MLLRNYLYFYMEIGIQERGVNTDWSQGARMPLYVVLGNSRRLKQMLTLT